VTSHPLPPAARALRTALREVVGAAQREDADALAEAGGRLDRVEPEQVRLVLGHVARGLVERSHPDGVDADDLSTLIEDVARGAAWCPRLSPTALVAVLSGAFGVHPDDEAPTSTAPAVVTAVAVLVAHLLRGRDVTHLLDAALAEVARAETVEMP
jgi:hypothetical protein